MMSVTVWERDDLSGITFVVWLWSASVWEYLENIFNTNKTHLWSLQRWKRQGFFFIITAEADIYNQMTTWLTVF